MIDLMVRSAAIAVRLEPCGPRERSACFIPPSFAGLVAIARSLYPIPSRTRPSNSSAPMVLSLKAWKSRSLPGLPRTELASPHHDIDFLRNGRLRGRPFAFAEYHSAG